jgi:hypothetical protein
MRLTEDPAGLPYKLIGRDGDGASKKKYYQQETKKSVSTAVNPLGLLPYSRFFIILH